MSHTDASSVVALSDLLQVQGTAGVRASADSTAYLSGSTGMELASECMGPVIDSVVLQVLYEIRGAVEANTAAVRVSQRSFVDLEAGCTGAHG